MVNQWVHGNCKCSSNECCYYFQMAGQRGKSFGYQLLQQSSCNFLLPSYILRCKQGSIIGSLCYIYIYIYIPPLHIYTTTTCNHHHTVQVGKVQVEYLRQWLEGKIPPAQVTTGDDHCMYKWGICTSCWKEKHHQCKLQQVLTTTCASGVNTPLAHVGEGKHHQRKVQRSGPASGQVGAGCSNSSCNYIHHTTDQIRTSTGAVGVPDAATCTRACRGNMVSPHASRILC